MDSTTYRRTVPRAQLSLPGAVCREVLAAVGSQLVHDPGHVPFHRALADAEGLLRPTGSVTVRILSGLTFTKFDGTRVRV